MLQKMTDQNENLLINITFFQMQFRETLGQISCAKLPPCVENIDSSGIQDFEKSLGKNWQCFLLSDCPDLGMKVRQYCYPS